MDYYHPPRPRPPYNTPSASQILTPAPLEHPPKPPIVWLPPISQWGPPANDRREWRHGGHAMDGAGGQDSRTPPSPMDTFFGSAPAGGVLPPPPLLPHRGLPGPPTFDGGDGMDVTTTPPAPLHLLPLSAAPSPVGGWPLAPRTPPPGSGGDDSDEVPVAPSPGGGRPAPPPSWEPPSEFGGGGGGGAASRLAPLSADGAVAPAVAPPAGYGGWPTAAGAGGSLLTPSLTAAVTAAGSALVGAGGTGATPPVGASGTPGGGRRAPLRLPPIVAVDATGKLWSPLVDLPVAGSPGGGGAMDTGGSPLGSAGGGLYDRWSPYAGAPVSGGLGWTPPPGVHPSSGWTPPLSRGGGGGAAVAAAGWTPPAGRAAGAVGWAAAAGAVAAAAGAGGDAATWGARPPPPLGVASRTGWTPPPSAAAVVAAGRGAGAGAGGYPPPPWTGRPAGVSPPGGYGVLAGVGYAVPAAREAGRPPPRDASREAQREVPREAPREPPREPPVGKPIACVTFQEAPPVPAPALLPPAAAPLHPPLPPVSAAASAAAGAPPPVDASAGAERDAASPPPPRGGPPPPPPPPRLPPPTHHRRHRPHRPPLRPPTRR